MDWWEVQETFSWACHCFKCGLKRAGPHLVGFGVAFGPSFRYKLWSRDVLRVGGALPFVLSSFDVFLFCPSQRASPLENPNLSCHLIKLTLCCTGVRGRMSGPLKYFEEKRHHFLQRKNMTLLKKNIVQKRTFCQKNKRSLFMGSQSVCS